ncbi:uncharacterized protein CTRU02_214921 [Colletotrichum truncatum]|uniref:Uncharacterized protein n=1 Tax=Colletotrichum truncatum TaxID=5467 RepID=A0ACC3YE26_COLTU|nr:uncharacterized protein CTRU02_08326 [Colletotrichum truncatum]KAF6790197.1 hypothetical protein CTRU02_08326 [Colletotrichum truncatum]
MPPKKNADDAAASTSHNCSEADINLMIAIIEMIPRPALDYDVLAEKLGSATANAARMRVSAAIKKHTNWFAGTNATTGEGGSPNKAPRAKRTIKNKEDPNEESLDEQVMPSKKRARNGKAKAKAAVEETTKKTAAKKENNDFADCQI